jgi:hypothetical protein
MIDLESIEMDNATNQASTDIVRMGIDSSWSLYIYIGFWLWIGLGFVFFSLLIVRIFYGKSFLQKSFELDSAEFGIGDSKITLKPNMNDRAVAYKIWVELSTRKIGLPIDFENDVIEEIYDSWYTFFAITRELIKDIPIGKVRDPSTKKIVALSIDILNQGLRPHLTKWQARFRRWYQHRVSKDVEAVFHPQDIQREFPEFAELSKDMLIVNDRLMKYRVAMDRLVNS